MQISAKHFVEVGKSLHSSWGETFTPSQVNFEGINSLCLKELLFRFMAGFDVAEWYWLSTGDDKTKTNPNKIHLEKQCRSLVNSILILVFDIYSGDKLNYECYERFIL